MVIEALQDVYQHFAQELHCFETAWIKYWVYWTLAKIQVLEYNFNALKMQNNSDQTNHQQTNTQTISELDVQLVVEQTGAPRHVCLRKLQTNGGDLVSAILDLTSSSIMMDNKPLA